METFDLIVIGAGPTGENVADYAAREGLSVALVEDRLVGGECSYWACMPTKALLRSGEVLRAARAVGGAAEAVTEDLDVAAVLARRDEFTHGWSDDAQVQWAREAGLQVVRGHGRLAGERRVTVTGPDGVDRELAARHAVAITAGTDPVVPDIDGLAEARAWTNREASATEGVPESIAIIGGGPVACEFATAFKDLGSDVMLVARSGLLGGMEAFAGDAVAKRLRERGAQVLTGTGVAKVRRDRSAVHLTTDDGGSLVAQQVLVATGRRPRTDDLGLETVGLKPGRWLDVDETMRVEGHDWLYAVGDVNHRSPVTHMGKYQARAAGAAIAARARDRAVDDSDWGRHVATADERAVPQVVFSDPEVASVGPTLAAARETGTRVRAVDVAIGDVAGATLRRDGYEGTARILVDEDRAVLIGATFVGPDVAELLHAATVAVVGEVPVDRLWHAVPSYPTVSEVWLRLLEAYFSQG